MAFLPSTSPRMARYGALLFFLMVFAGCASPSKLLERATQSEENGEYAQSAMYYIGVLEKESDWEDARDGLMRVGTIAVDNYFEKANALEETGEFDEAIKTLDEMDDMRVDALGVGVTLSLPPDYDAYRERLSESAIVSLIRRGERAEDEGDWEEALETYERVQDRYELTVDQDEEMLLARARVHTRWAEQEIEQGRHRRGFDRAADAIAVLGEDHPRAGSAFDLQDRAIEEGTRFVAFLPIGQTEDVEDAAPSGLIDEIDDLLQYNYWADPPLFVAQSDPVQMRRELRRLRYDNRLITRSEASNIGNELDADFVVVLQAVEFRLEERRMREKTKKTETTGRNPQDTTYIEQSFTGHLEAEIEYRIIDTDSKREVADGSVAASASAKMQRGVYDGDYRDLDLSRSERKLFDEEELDLVLNELEDELIDDLAPQLADEVFEKLLDRID